MSPKRRWHEHELAVPRRRAERGGAGVVEAHPGAAVVAEAAQYRLTPPLPAPAGSRRRRRRRCGPRRVSCVTRTLPGRLSGRRRCAISGIVYLEPRCGSFKEWGSVGSRRCCRATCAGSTGSRRSGRRSPSRIPSPPTPEQLSRLIRSEAARLGLTSVGFAAVRPALRLSRARRRSRHRQRDHLRARGGLRLRAVGAEPRARADDVRVLRVACSSMIGQAGAVHPGTRTIARSRTTRSDR